MTAVVRLLTLLTIAAAGFAMPMTCAQPAAAAQPHIAVEQTLPPLTESQVAASTRDTGNLLDRAIDSVPFDCGNAPAQRTADHPATFDTQPFVPGYLVTDDRPDFGSDRPPTRSTALIPVESRAGPPDAPPPKSID